METNFKFMMPKERSSIIKVIGVGGGGCNAVNHMQEQGIKGVDFIVCNTDLQALEASTIVNKIQLGANLTQGLGAGANPEVGKKAAMEAIEDIIDMLGVNTKMLFITAGMGGGTGTGAAPIIAKTAKEMDILTVGIVTTPFNFEGKRRKSYANEGLENLKRSVDCLLIISNDKIKEMFGNLALREAFGHANNILTTAAKGIAEIITHPGYINVDFEDVKTVMKSSGVALMGSATAQGENRAINAVKAALASPLLNDNQITGAKNILLNITSGTEEVLMEEVEQISSYIQQESGLTAEMIFGTSFDENLGASISVTLIATGFEPRENKIIIGSTENSFQSTFIENKQPEIISAPTFETIVEPIEFEINEEFETETDTEIESTIELDITPEINNDFDANNELVKFMLTEDKPVSEIENEELPDMRFELKVAEISDEVNSIESNDEMEIYDFPNDIPEFEDEMEEIEELEFDAFGMTSNEETEITSHVQQIMYSTTETTSNLNTSEPINEDQDKRIEKHIQRIKELKNLNITIASPQGLRDLEKEPAYKRRNKRLDDVPHSSEQQISRLSLFEDASGKSELKTNNSFLHDNVD